MKMLMIMLNPRFIVLTYKCIFEVCLCVHAQTYKAVCNV